MKTNYVKSIKLICATCGSGDFLAKDEESGKITCTKCNRVYHGGYDELVDAISTAIEKSEKLDGATVVEHAIEAPEEKALTYEEVRDKAKVLWEALVAKDPEENPKRIMKKVEMIFGRPMKLSEINEDQVDLYNLVVLEMEDMLNSN